MKAHHDIPGLAPRHDQRGLRSRCVSTALVVATVLLLTGCGSELRARYTLHQDAILDPGRSQTNDLAIAFGLDEFAERDTAIASAAALRTTNFD